MSAKFTPGPWRWELNEKHKSIHLVGGKPMYDLTILQPIRWGMYSATFFIRDTAYDGLNLLHKLHERRDWITHFDGRKHHVSWCADVNHPDMRLISAAPDLLEALELFVAYDKTVNEDGLVSMEAYAKAIKAAHAAISKATGEPQC